MLHTVLFSTLGISTRNSFTKIPQIEIYKVSIAPLPQPKVSGKAINRPETKVKKNLEKSAPKKENKSKSSSWKKLPDGLPDIRPEIYTGSGRGFNYSYYLNILLNKIAQNWNNPYRNKDVILKSIVYFEVGEDGLITNIRIEDDSGDEVYNESTLRAVALTKKLPPLPQEFSDDYLKVHLEFLTAR
ncbi:TonB family protein [candidate division WOR-3 bacterium]|nr:TonB family protein [candidate division WOR-3 bacterium]